MRIDPEQRQDLATGDGHVDPAEDGRGPVVGNEPTDRDADTATIDCG
jgi:hypothetical protein